jgi:diacylglycerol O-acyltransferase
MALVQPSRFSALDAVFLNFERKEMPLHIGGAMIFEGAIPFERFVATIESRLELIPRYRQKAVRPFLNIGYPTWQYDPDFDIRRHIFHVKLDRPGTEEELRKLTGQIFTPLLDHNKPLWETYVVDGLKGGRSAIICKVHHCMVDGVAGIGLLNIMLDASPDKHPRPRRKPYHPPKPPDPAWLFLECLTDSIAQIPKRLRSVQMDLSQYGALLKGDDVTLVGLQRLADMFPEVMVPMEKLPFNRPCSGEREVYWTEFPFAETRAIRTACGVTVNDVILGVVAGAVSRYCELHRQTVKNRFYRAMVPVNLRDPSDPPGAVGNRISLLPVVLPLGIRDPVERLRHIHAQTQAMKAARVAELVRMGIAWLGVLPPGVQKFLADSLGWLNTPIPIFHMVCTNVPGPQIPLYSCGKRMLTCYPHVPTGMDVGISVAIESYDQMLYFALTVDKLAAPDGERMKEFLEASFVEMRKALKVPPSSPHVTRTRAPRAPKPKAKTKTRKPAAPRRKPAKEPSMPAAGAQPALQAASEVQTKPPPSLDELLSVEPAEEEAVEDVTLTLDEELEPVH